MSLYRKYRPKSLKTFIGNEADAASIQKHIDNPERPHTYLVSGPSGCGKTTIARIFAKELGAGKLSIHEINTANNRGIDSAREIEESMKYPALGNGVKIFIIDECHNMTKVAQDALLKPLEDTPKHVYFFLCTTDPQNLKKAIHTRSTPIKVKPIDSEKIYKLLRKVVAKEGKEVDKGILEEIADTCEGSPRQALVTLENIIDMTDKKQMRVVIKSGQVDEAEVKELCQALLNGEKWKAVSAILKRMKGLEPESVRYAVMGYMNAVLLNSGKEQAAIIIENFADNFYDSKAAGLTLACYNVVFGE